MKPLSVGSLCTGYGGLEMGLAEVLDTEVAWVADNDRGAAKLLAYRHPQVPNIGDIKSVDWSELPAVDIVTGGYPCQPFSSAGRQKGIKDERHIWPYIADALRVLRPRYALFENVANHLGLGFDVVLADLAGLGFDVEWRLVRASDIGAAHKRARLIFLATAADAPHLGHERLRHARRRRLGPADRGLPTADPAGGDERQRQGPGDRRAQEPARGRSSASADTKRHGPQGQRSDAGPLPRRPTPTAVGCGSVRGSNAPADTDGDGRARGQECDSHTEARREVQHRDDTDGRILDWGVYGAAIRRWETILGRPAPRPTELGANGQPRLTPAFSEWLMGLPAGWVTDLYAAGQDPRPNMLSRTAALKLLGNGVVPQQAAAALRLLLPAVLDAQREPAA